MLVGIVKLAAVASGIVKLAAAGSGIVKLTAEGLKLLAVAVMTVGAAAVSSNLGLATVICDFPC